MLRAPAFWWRDDYTSRALSPISPIVSSFTAKRIARSGWRAPVPVICCGNAVVGGAGKTTLVLDLARRLSHRNPHVLLRGYRGVTAATHRVRSDDPATMVGDEALLLAQVAPTWIGADRALSACAAIRSGAAVLLMDDGLQNPTLTKTTSILVVDGRTGFGNGRVLPAGPLREPIEAAASRCQAAVLIGDDQANVLAQLPSGLDVMRADLVQDPKVAELAGHRILAFAGIALPEKFFGTLRQAGADLVAVRSFPDHYDYHAKDLRTLSAEARRLNAVLVTTPKDAVRLPPAFLAQVVSVGVTLKWRQPGEIDGFLDRALDRVPNPDAGD